MDGITPIRGLLATLAVALLSVGASASASGARQGVKAQPGEIVLLRDVSARPAYRMAPPGMALVESTTSVFRAGPEVTSRHLVGMRTESMT